LAGIAVFLASACGHTHGSPGGGDLGASDDPDLSVVEQGPTVDGSIAVDLLDVDALSFAQRCWSATASAPHANYDQFNPTYARTHCSGTNEQSISGVQRIVFLGDSITVGTPPTAAGDLYRSKLAVHLATKFGLAAPDLSWMNVDLIKQVSLTKTSGAFTSCARWGARIKDLTGPDGANQIGQCFDDVEPLRTLIILTTVGNDFADFAKEGTASTPTPIPMILAESDTRLTQLATALDRLTDPAHFPNGSYVIIANNYEFTDATGDVPSCASAVTAGLGAKWPAGLPVFLHLNEQILAMAVAHNVDTVFMAEAFCGHGFHKDDPASPCYRGPATPLWFDPTTCTHPNTAGHDALAKLFFDVVNE